MNLQGYKAIKKSALFDSTYYYEKNPDVKKEAIDPLLHYIFHGYTEGRNPSPIFDGNHYLKKYSDIKKSHINPLIHYLLYGQYENRRYKFIKSYKFKKEYKIILKSKKFDLTLYKKKYPEVEKMSMDPIMHYLEYGAKKNYNPSINFQTKWYIEKYQDVSNTNMNPFAHYLYCGIKQGRLPKPLNQIEVKNKYNEIINANKSSVKLFSFNENSPKISIIILTRDGLSHLKRLFKDFEYKLQYPKYEIIVVDNGSKDETITFLEKLSKELHIKILKNDFNKSFSEANNNATSISTGDYFLFLNNDMEPLYGWLNHMMQSILLSNDIGAVGSKLIFSYSKNQDTPFKTQHEGIAFKELNGYLEKNDGYIVPYNIKGNDPFEKVESDLEIGAVLGACFLIKKEVFKELGGFDESFFYNYEDIDLCLKLHQKGYKIVYSPKSVLFHYYEATRKGNNEHAIRDEIDLKNREILYFKWNKILREIFLKDKLNNDLIFSKKPLKIGIIGKTDETSIFNYKKVINNFGWKIKFLKDSYVIPSRFDVIISNSSTYNPNNIKYNNKYLIKIAFIDSNLEKWISNEYFSFYDFIITNNEDIHSKLMDIYSKKVILVKNNFWHSVKNNINELIDMDYIN
ncbi:MAG: glycosyltransferase family 2 protein [Methanobacteriaceae archaeon]|nr:glycosyltransferase family 2 protein [Candidatus Methanorudis spinitermitis]